MSRKENLSYIFIGSLILIFGFALVLFRESFVFLLAEVIQIVLVLIGGWELFNTYIIRKHEGKLTERTLAIGKAILYITVGLILVSWPEFTTGWLILFIGFYQFSMGVIGLLSYYLLKRDHVTDLNDQLTIALVHFLFGFMSMIGSSRISQTLIRLGIYLMFIGFTYINDGRQLLRRRHHTQKLKKRIRIPLPVIIEAIIPNNVLIKFNEQLQDGDVPSVNSWPAGKEYKEANIVHILIQVGPTGFDRIGHVDVSYKDKVYSYGNHDVESHRLAGAIGDGVLAVVDEQLYLDYLKSRRVSVFRFGIVLTDDELGAFKVVLDNLMEQTIPWTLETEKQAKSFIGRILNTAGAKAYKFKEGRYKTYFVLGTNCVLLADELLGNNGINIINLSGILAPGTYYDYFNKLFHTKGTNVISKMLVHPQLDSALIEAKETARKLKK